MDEQLGQWAPLLESVFSTPEMEVLGKRLASVKSLQPNRKNIFRAFKETSPKALKVVIIGQDPYPNGADGLAFSHNNFTPSLQVIFKELEREGFNRSSTKLDDWAQQGVLLMNTCLTTETGFTFAHKDWGWDVFTRFTLEKINKLPQPFVVMAWGTAAKNLADKHISPGETRLVLKAPHPMSDRYGKNPDKFVGCDHFIKANEYLIQHGLSPINW